MPTIYHQPRNGPSTPTACVAAFAGGGRGPAGLSSGRARLRQLACIRAGQGSDAKAPAASELITPGGCAMRQWCCGAIEVAILRTDSVQLAFVWIG